MDPFSKEYEWNPLVPEIDSERQRVVLFNKAVLTFRVVVHINMEGPPNTP